MYIAASTLQTILWGYTATTSNLGSMLWDYTAAKSNLQSTLSGYSCHKQSTDYALGIYRCYKQSTEHAFRIQLPQAIYGLCFGDIRLQQAIYTARFRDTVARIFHSVHTVEFNLETDVLRAPTTADSCFVVICSQGAWG